MEATTHNTTLIVSDPAIPMSLRKWNRSVKKFCIEDIGMSGEF